MRGADGDRLRGYALATRMRVQDEQLVGEAAETLQNRVELPGRLQLVEPAEAMEHPLDQAAIDPLVFDEEQIGAIAVGLSADEYAVVLVSSDITR